MINKILKNIAENDWRFAKTMPEHPHWYTLRKNWKNDQDFVDFVLFIREHGYQEVFKGTTYTLFNINGYKYWTMGCAINTPSGEPYTILINRAEIDYETDYDKIAYKYDGLFTDALDQEENQEVMDMIKPVDNVLDIGFGTGLLLDYFDIENYTGIDISQKMIEVFKGKHPQHIENICRTTVKDFYTTEKFDLIVGLFGVGSYLSREEIMKAKSMLSPGGRIFLMFYATDYTPETYIRTGININYFNRFKSEQLIEFNNYFIYDEKNN